MDELDILYAEKVGESGLEIELKKLRKKVLETKFPGTIVPRTDPEFLAKFLRVKDYSIEKALTAIQKYYRCIHKHMDQHIDLRPSDLVPAFSSETIRFLKHRLDGSLVALARIEHWNTKEVKLIEFQNVALFEVEQYLNEVEIQKHGISAIVDFDGLRMEHIWQASIKELRKCVELAVKGIPIRLKEAHVLNTPKIFWPIYQVFKRFLKQKYIDRIHFHDNLESLHKRFDKRMLPQSLNGDLSEFDATERHIVESILKDDVPFEKYWNGALWKPTGEVSMMKRRRSSTA